MKSISQITLYDLMAEDMEVWIYKNHNDFTFTLEIDDEKNEQILKDSNIHPYAADSLAEFCKQYLLLYNREISREI